MNNTPFNTTYNTTKCAHLFIAQTYNLWYNTKKKKYVKEMKTMEKHIANIVTMTRVIGATLLFTRSKIDLVFLSVYVFCGFTDLIDGPIARKLGSSSALGATLDTIGDVLTYLALTKILINNNLVPVWIIIWILCAGVLFGFCAFISKRRFNKFYLPHTYLGKIFGGSVFVLPLGMQFMPKNICMSIICTIASIHAIELFYIQLHNYKADPFVPSAFHINKANTN